MKKLILLLFVCGCTTRGTEAPTPIIENKAPPPPIIIFPPKKEEEKSPATEALDEVNAARKKRGLPPFIKDEELTKVAMKLAIHRAERLIGGHVNDFSFLPKGVKADSFGCGALPDSWGWGTCCTYDNYRYAGAAWMRGKDRKRYMHIAVRR